MAIKLLPCFDYTKLSTDQKKRINEDKLRETGIVEYTNLAGYKSDGVFVVEHKYIDQSRLKLERFGRIGATGSSVVLNLVSALGLFYSGGKLLFNSILGRDTEDSYKSLGNSYTASAVAGALTGAAHESPEWSLGNIGMGFFSRYLEKIWGLAGFSISEGLSSIGMGKVRFRDEENVSAVKNSIFNSDALSKFRFLMPIEQSILKFKNRLLNPASWKRFITEEPYSLFQTCGGGLISAGGVLGLASIFKNKMSEALQSFFYLPYSFFSLANLVAFFRDGDVMLTRAKDFGSRKKGELYSMRAEGHCKRVASPFLALNNFFLALKGLGLETSNGLLYNVGMSFRAFGAAIAFLSFKSQSLLKFFKPDLFGPKFKEVMKIVLNLIKEGKRIFKFMDDLNLNKPDVEVQDELKSIVFDKNNKHRDIIQALINTKTFQSMKGKTQIGLPTQNQPLEGNRSFLNRYVHSIQVCAVGRLIYEALLKNTTAPELRKLLIENEDAFKLAPLLHDIGHVARSHTAERAVKGHNNDENTVNILKDPNSDISQTIFSYYGRETGEKILTQVRDIIGKWSPLFKAFKLSDFVEYTRCGDFVNITGFPKWTMDDVKKYVDNIRLHRDKNGKVITGFTEYGAVQTFVLLFDRKVFNDTYNYNPISFAEEYPYLLGLDARDISSEEIKLITEDRVDQYVQEGLQSLKNARFQFRVKHQTGGERAYTGYSKYNPEKKIMVIPDGGGEPVEFLEYYETVIKNKDKALYEDLKARVNGLVTTKEFDLTINVVDN